MKIVFMGTPDFAVPSLKAIDEAGYKIKLVISQKDRPRGRGKKIQYPPVKETALKLGTKVYQPSNINSTETIEKLKDIDPDFIIVAAYGQILSKKILDIPKYGAINVHASLLPKYRGPAPINWAIINGENETGITIMRMEEGLDTGDMLGRESIEILDRDDCASIHDRLSKVGANLLIETMKKIVSGEIKGVPQDHDKSSYAPMIFKDTGKIDWNKGSRQIFNLVRGLKPWPATYTSYKGENLKIHEIEIDPKPREGRPGEIVKVSNKGIYVKTGDSAIIVKTLQFPNKRKMKVHEYLAGNSIDLGIILE